MQRVSSSLITKKQEMLKNQTPSFGNQTKIDDSSLKNRTLKFGTWNVEGCRSNMEEIIIIIIIKLGLHVKYVINVQFG